MTPPDDILLTRYVHYGETHELWAVLDEVSSTYHVVLRYQDGDRRRLKAHTASLADARRWAECFAEVRGRVGWC